MSVLPRCYGVLGHPIGHSLSPVMHQAAFDVLGEPHRYLAFDVAPERLGEALSGAAALGLGGLNLTVPHKRPALDLMDRVAPEVERVGALNTVVFESDALVGHGTDGIGFLRGLAELGPIEPRKAVLLGGGGAARFIADALTRTDPPFALTWISRRAQTLPSWAGATTGSWSDLPEALAGASLLVNATTVGMRGGPTDFPVQVPLERLAPNAAVVDIVYPRPPGGLLDAAQAQGARVQDGRAMLLWQGVAAQELWRGQGLPARAVEAMRLALHRRIPG